MINEMDQWWLRHVKKKYGLRSKKDLERFVKYDRARSKKDPIYFINEHLFVKNKFPDQVPDHLEVVGDKIRFKLYPRQEDLVKAFINSQRLAVLKTRQTGVSTTFQGIALWMAEFFNNKEIVIISKNEEAAKDFLQGIKFMYLNLPPWLRRRCLVDNKKTLALGPPTSASIIRSLTSGKSTGRGISASLLILDEAEFIQNVEEIWAAAAPILSATNGKAVVISTPYWSGSWFHKLCKGAEEGSNAFTLFKFHWKDIPGRDQKWYEQECKTLNNDPNLIKTELHMKWIIKGDRYFAEELTEKLKVLKPIKRDKEWMIFQKPIKDNQYVIGVDLYEGGSDYNAMFILNVTEILNGGDGLVADYRSKELNIKDELIKMSRLYNDAALVIERNKGFSLIRDLVDEGYGNLVVRQFDFNRREFKQDYGLYVSHNRTYLLTLASKWLSNAKTVTPRLLDEMENFILRGVRYEGRDHDDILFAFIYALYHIDIVKLFQSKKRKGPQRGWLKQNKLPRALQNPAEFGLMMSKDYVEGILDNLTNPSIRSRLPT